MAINRDKVLASAVKLLQAGKFEKAIAEFKRLIDDDPKDVRTILKVGDAYVKMGRRAEAIEAYERVAKIYSDQGFYLKAVAVFKQMLRVDPNLPDVHLQLAEMYQQLGLSSDALQHYQQVAVFYEQKGSTQESLNILKRMVDLDPDNLPSRIKLAELFAQQGMNQEAIAEFRSAGDYLLEQERHEDYLRVGERLIYFDPRALDVTRQLAEIYLKSGQAKLALGKLQICFKAQPRDLEILELISSAFRAMGQTAKTVSVYKEMARIHETDGDVPEAQRAWQRVLEVDPGDAEAQQALQGGAPAGVAATPPPAAAPEPQVDPEAEELARLLTETDVYLKYKLYDKAIDHVRKALAIRPDLIDAHDKLRAVYQGMNDRDGLMGQLRVLIQHGENSGDPRLEEWRHDLEALQAAPPPPPENTGDFSDDDFIVDGLSGEGDLVVEVPADEDSFDGTIDLDEASLDIVAAEAAPGGPPPIPADDFGEAIVPESAPLPVDEPDMHDAATMVLDTSMLPDLPPLEEELPIPAGPAIVEPEPADLPPEMTGEALLAAAGYQLDDEPILEPAQELIIPASTDVSEEGAPSTEISLPPDDNNPFGEATGLDAAAAAAQADNEVSFVDQAAVEDALAEARELERRMRDETGGFGDDSFDGISSADALPLDAADEVVRALEGASDDDLLAGFESSIADAPAVTEIGGNEDLHEVPSDEMAAAFQQAAAESLADDEFGETGGGGEFSADATELMELSLEEMDEIRGLISQASAAREQSAAPSPVPTAADDFGDVTDLPSAAELMQATSGEDELDLNSLAAAAASEVNALLDGDESFGGGTEEIRGSQTSPDASESRTAAEPLPADTAYDPEDMAAAFEGGISFPPPLEDYEATGDVPAESLEAAAAIVAAEEAGMDDGDEETLHLDPSELAEAIPEDVLAEAADLEIPDGVEVPPPEAMADQTEQAPAPIPELKSPAGPTGKRGSLGVSEEAYGFEDDPAAAFFPDELEEAEFFIQNEILDEAKEILEEIIDNVPDSLRAQWMMQRIEAIENGEPEPLAPWKQRIIDEVAEELGEDDGNTIPPPSSQPEQVSLEEVLSQFKKGVAEAVSDDDADTHYNLGIAYKEMGLHDDAITEFHMAARAPSRRVDSLLLIAGVQREKGDIDAALATIDEAAADPNAGDKERGVAAYEQGICLEELGREPEAREAYERARALGGDMGDLESRIAKLSAGGPPPSAGASRKNIDYV